MMIDIHSHILPGVDDGAASLEESLMMAEMAVKSGVKVLVATPHSNQPGAFRNYDSREMRERYRQLKEAVKVEGIPLQLIRGMEIFATSELAEKVEKKQVIPLNRSRYYLIEFAFNASPHYIEDRITEMLEIGQIPVIAHPERYYCVQDDPNQLYHWRMLGALAQMNKGSVFGRFGARTEQAAEIILKHCLVNCIASDAHGVDFRTTDMREIRHFLDQHFPEEVCRLLLHVNPGCILKNKPLPRQAMPIPIEQKKHWFW